MAAERALVAKVAETVADIAINDSSLITAGTEDDALKLISPHIDDMEHKRLVQIAVNLLQRFQRTVVGQFAPLEPLAAVVEQMLLPAITKLDVSMSSHRAFKTAFSLTPLLTRVTVLAAQCCGFAVRDISDAASVLVLTRSLTDFSEVLAGAVVGRIDSFR
eukprot:CAMPEP_0179286378 /NCGR_PEP_ID=MMETSP0797-20121207/39713_1 /TAXON_ID=47934 /ORGANISM="Dinophysis acuminata, Strain DAEP01" /LENGTH=160 /DNA_ID=CAMNT_0020995265 /DNA_START=42 /DNA_END=521 /DNA_ORIENTATION=+